MRPGYCLTKDPYVARVTHRKTCGSGAKERSGEGRAPGAEPCRDGPEMQTTRESGPR